jgi:RNA polymerase sigma-70 factor, ECF subfamily
MSGQPITQVLSMAEVVTSPSDRVGALFDAHADRLYRLARRLTSSTDDARDLVQETFLRAAISPGAIPAGSSGEEAWLVRVLVNIQRDQWRRAAVRKRHAESEVGGHRLILESDHEAVLIARTTIWRALDRLKPRRRAVLIMHELEGLAVPAIASLLGITVITTRWHLSKGRHDLARVLKGQLEDAR